MAGVSATFIGDASLSKRPMKRIMTPLLRMGAGIEGGDFLPLTVAGASLGGIDYVNVPASAQVKSAILLAGISGTAPVRMSSRYLAATIARSCWAVRCPVAVVGEG